MKTIIKHQALDGSEWNNESDCLKRDALHLACVQAMGKGWLQHDKETVNRAKDCILDICREQGMAERYPVFLHPGRMIHPRSGVGRILDDCGGPLSDAWSRFGRIDEQGREHQQCYYAYTNGPDPEHVCIEDRRT